MNSVETENFVISHHPDTFLRINATIFAIYMKLISAIQC